MRALALAATAAFLLANCATPKRSFVPEPWPGKLTSELLYWCVPEGDGIWEVSEREPEGCENISRGEWKSYPVVVSALDDSLEKETIEAITYFNARLGFDLFQYEQGNLVADIQVFTAGDHPRAAAQAVLYTYEARMRGMVLVYNGFEDRDRSDVMVHELGHLVGLKHDPEDRLSLMYPWSASRLASLTAEDIKVLRQLYGHL